MDREGAAGEKRICAAARKAVLLKRKRMRVADGLVTADHTERACQEVPLIGSSCDVRVSLLVLSLFLLIVWWSFIGTSTCGSSITAVVFVFDL